MTNEVPAAERQALYSTASCLFVTTRILVVDQLSGRIDADQIAGMVVLNAHRWGRMKGSGVGGRCWWQAGGAPAAPGCRTGSRPCAAPLPGLALPDRHAILSVWPDAGGLLRHMRPPCAHAPRPLRVTDSSGEGFAVRLYKTAAPRGVVRAFSDLPSSFASEFNKARDARKAESCTARLCLPAAGRGLAAWRSAAGRGAQHAPPLPLGLHLSLSFAATTNLAPRRFHANVCIFKLLYTPSRPRAAPVFATPEYHTVDSLPQVEKVMKALYVRRLYLWPRFQAQARQDLEARPPQVGWGTPRAAGHVICAVRNRGSWARVP